MPVIGAVHLLLAERWSVGMPLDADVLTDPFGWLVGGLVRAIYGSDDMNAVHQALNGWSAHLLDAAGPGNPFRLDAMCGRCGDIYADLRPLGVFALALAVMARMAGQALRSRHEGMSPVHLLADAGIRLVCGLAALQATFQVLDWLSSQSMVLAGELGGLVFGAVLRQIDANSLADAVFQSVSGQNQLASALEVILLTIFVGYLGVMIVASRAAIIFCVLVAPFSVPAMAYAEDAKLVVLWLRLLFFALAVPAASVLCLAVTAVVFAASHSIGIAAIPQVAMVACIWISVKVINSLMRATLRGVRGSVSSTMHAAGMGPATHRLGAMSRDARRDLGRVAGVGRMVGGAAVSGGVDGVKGLLRTPAPGLNAAFEVFASRQMVRGGRSMAGGADLPPEKQKAERARLWASFLARESGLIGRPERAA